MNEHPFQHFIDLINFDQAIRSGDFQITQLKQEIAALQQDEKAHADRLDIFKQNAIDLKKQVDSLELEIKELDEQEKDKKVLMDNATDNKMYQSAKRELDRVKQQQHELEEELLNTWNKLEAAQKELADQQAQTKEKVASVLEAKNEREQKVQALEADLSKLHEQRPEKERKVPGEWLEKYTHMKMSVDDPVVKVLNGGCGACFYTISNQDMLHLKRRALIQCKGCFRLLYLEEAMASAAQEQA